MSIFEPTRFKGILSTGNASVPVVFVAEVDNRGELQLTFEPQSPGADALIPSLSVGLGRRVEYRSLSGAAASGEQFVSDTFYLNGFDHRDRDGASELVYRGRCTEASLGSVPNKGILIGTDL